MTMQSATAPGTAIIVGSDHPVLGLVLTRSGAAQLESPKGDTPLTPLRRPSRLCPLPEISNHTLREAAKKHQPPAEWFEGEEDRPF